MCVWCLTASPQKEMVKVLWASWPAWNSSSTRGAARVSDEALRGPAAQEKKGSEMPS